MSEDWFSQKFDLIILEAKIFMVEGNLKETMEHLEKARTLAHEQGFNLLVEKADFELRQLETQFEVWEQLIENNAPIQHRFKRARIEDYIKEAQKMVQLH